MHSRSEIRRALFAVVVLALATGLVYGQAFTSLSGTVGDATGAMVPSAAVAISNVQTGAQREATTDNAGRYSFAQVLPGTYKVTAKAQGFSEFVLNTVELLVNSPATINITLQVGAVTQSVQVEAAAVRLNTTDASLGNAIGTTAIVELPFFARNVTGLLQYQPGVTSFGAGDDRDGAVNGGKSDQANVTLDGVDVNDQNGRAAFTSVLRVTLDSVREFRTTTSNGGADSGRGSGADVALVTKQGTNSYHGSLYEYHRNTVTAANGFFNNRAKVPRAPLLINVFGASVGGPIRKNKAFFFLNYEGRRDASSSSVTRTVPTDTLRQGIVQFRDSKNVLKQIGPAEIKALDPLGIGVNQAVLKIFQNDYPRGNDNSIGDGMNTTGFRFNAPTPLHQNTYIARLDYTLDNAGKHQLFWRGNLQNDGSITSPQFPGQQPNSVGLANNKGFAAGYTALLRPNLISTLRWGLTRLGTESTGVRTSSFTYFRGFSDPYGTSTGSVRIVPVHNVTEDLAWVHGAHDIRFGGLLRFVNNGLSSYARAYNSAVTNASFLAGSGADITPASLDVNRNDTTSYTYAMTALMGLITQGNGNYNYDINGNTLSTGTPVGRHWKNEEYEFYAQDTWKIRRNLTITAGLRYALEPPVHEANGIQTSSNKPFTDWLDQRGALADQGRSQAEAGDLQAILANSPGGRPLYPYHKNWSPRLGIAYTPNGDSGLAKFLFGNHKTVIRTGAGLYYDLMGQPLAGTFSGNMFGLSSSVSNPGNVLTAVTAPRFTDFWSVPASLVPPAPKGGFPVTFPKAFQITGGLDDKLAAPYTMNLNFSIARELPRGFLVQGSYVGRLSRRSLIQRDIAMPTNLKDPKSGQTYFEAMTLLATLIDFQGVTVANLPKIPFFENMWASAAAGGFTATQIIAKDYTGNSAQGDFTNTLANMDQYCNRSGTTLRSTGTVSSLACSVLGPNAMFNAQFSALSGWSSIGSGSYHAMQWTASKRMGDSQFDLNYTFSKSIDLSSNAERAATFTGFVINSWNPGQLRGVSNYDTRHNFNSWGIYQLPFGKGKKFGRGVNRAIDAFIGGWQITGTFRLSSGLPVSPSDGSRWATNWQLSSYATPNGKPIPKTTSNKNAPAVGGTGGPNLWDDPTAAVNAFAETMPGQTGTRNTIRGQGYFDIDSGVGKSFTMPWSENHRLQFRWESFNLTNTIRFDPRSANMSLTSKSNWGKLSGQLGQPRQMQFALRYMF